jgi:hypothetical protein
MDNGQPIRAPASVTRAPKRELALDRGSGMGTMVDSGAAMYCCTRCALMACAGHRRCSEVRDS